VAEVKLPPSAKPSKACDWNCTRPALQHGIVTEEGGKRVLITTDSYILARHPVADDTPLGLIHPKALKRIEKRLPHDAADGSVTVKAEAEEVTWRPFANGKVPFSNKPAPQFEPDGEVITIALNPRLLRRLAQALGEVGRGVQLEIPVKDGTCEQAIRVTTYDDNGAEGLIMPIKVKETDRAA